MKYLVVQFVRFGKIGGYSYLKRRRGSRSFWERDPNKAFAYKNRKDAQRVADECARWRVSGAKEQRTEVVAVQK